MLRNLPPKNSSTKNTKYDNYFTQNPNKNMSSLAIAKSIHSMVKKNICSDRISKDYASEKSDKHASSISFGSTNLDLSTKPKEKSIEKETKFIKNDSKKTITSDAIFNYSSNNYNSSNIIKMLRVKQEVHKDPRLGLSKEQLLTRLITVEQEYRNIKANFENRRNQQSLDKKQITDYQNLIENTEILISDHQAKFEEMNSSIMSLWRINYFAVDLYKQITDIAKDRKQSSYKSPSRDALFEIIDKIEQFLSSNEFNISVYEEKQQQNRDFIDLLIKKKTELSQVRENLFNLCSSAKQPNLNIDCK